MKNKFITYVLISITILLLKFFMHPQYFALIFTSTAYSYVMLLSCMMLVYSKRADILDNMSYSKNTLNPKYTIIGSIITIIFFFSKSLNPMYMIFVILMLLLGLFILFYPKASILPSILIMIYFFAISFPIILNNYCGYQYSLITTIIVAHISSFFYPFINHHNNTISYTNIQGVNTQLYIDAACSGSVSLSLFFTIFALMLIDVRPKLNLIFPLFLFGLLGTSIQNIIRLVLLVFSNYYYGESIMWKIHDYAGYVLFPIWFTIFIYVYLKIVGKYPATEI